MRAGLPKEIPINQHPSHPGLEDKSAHPMDRRLSYQGKNAHATSAQKPPIPTTGRRWNGKWNNKTGHLPRTMYAELFYLFSSTACHADTVADVGTILLCFQWYDSPTADAEATNCSRNRSGIRCTRLGKDSPDRQCLETTSPPRASVAFRPELLSQAQQARPTNFEHSWKIGLFGHVQEVLGKANKKIK